MISALATVRRSGWTVYDLAHATELALAIFKAEDRFVECIVTRSPMPRDPGATAPLFIPRSVGDRHGEEATRR